MTEEYSKGFILYKPRGDASGAASQWNLGSKKDCVFLEMANQTGKDDSGNARFDWSNKIRFKLGEPDIGEFLAVLSGLQDAVGPFSGGKHKGLFHSNKNGNAVLYFGKDEHGRFHIHLSVKKGNDQPVVAKHAMSKGEACILGSLLRNAIKAMYRWY